MTRRIMDRLTDTELEQLKAFTAGYGRTRYACQLSKVPVSSMRNFLLTGKGMMANIKKLRSTILKDAGEAKLESISNKANTAA